MYDSELGVDRCVETKVTFHCYALTDENGGESNYFKLRDLGRTLGFDVSWYPSEGIVIDTQNLYNDVY